VGLVTDIISIIILLNSTKEYHKDKLRCNSFSVSRNSKRKCVHCITNNNTI